MWIHNISTLANSIQTIPIHNISGLISVSHCSDVIMGAMSQITSPNIVRCTVYSGAYQREHQRSASLAFVREFTGSPVTGEFPTQMASNTSNVSIWCRHHEPYIRIWRTLQILSYISLRMCHRNIEICIAHIKVKLAQYQSICLAKINFTPSRWSGWQF